MVKKWLVLSQSASPAWTVQKLVCVDPHRQERIAEWYAQVVSLSAQVMRFPSDLSAFLKLPAVSPRER
jgi:hypothetical protein